MPTIQQQKQTLREALRSKAAQLPGEYLAMSDAAIEKRVLALPAWRTAQTVFLYVSVRAEPSTQGLLQAALESGKRVLVPRCLPGGQLEARQIEDLNVLRPAAFGLWEPDENAALLPPGALDLAVVPCVAADKAGHRLGNGAGFYDRYLAQTSCPTICLCRGVLLQASLPTKAFDIPVQMVLTENGAWPQPE